MYRFFSINLSLCSFWYSNGDRERDTTKEISFYSLNWDLPAYIGLKPTGLKIKNGKVKHCQRVIMKLNHNQCVSFSFFLRIKWQTDWICHPHGNSALLKFLRQLTHVIRNSSNTSLSIAGRGVLTSFQQMQHTAPSRARFMSIKVLKRWKIAGISFHSLPWTHHKPIKAINSTHEASTNRKCMSIKLFKR